MKSKQKRPHPTREELRKAAMDGLSYRQIGRLHGRSIGTISQLMHNMGLDHLVPAREPLEKALKSGLTYAQMAQLFDMSINGVLMALKREKLYTARNDGKPKAQFALRFTLSDIEILGKLKIAYRTTNHSETIREAVRKAAVAAGVLKEERE